MANKPKKIEEVKEESVLIETGLLEDICRQLVCNSMTITDILSKLTSSRKNN